MGHSEALAKCILTVFIDQAAELDIVELHDLLKLEVGSSVSDHVWNALRSLIAARLLTVDVREGIDSYQLNAGYVVEMLLTNQILLEKAQGEISKLTREISQLRADAQLVLGQQEEEIAGLKDILNNPVALVEELRSHGYELELED